MEFGIRTTVEFTNSNICPITSLSDDANTSIDSVSTSVSTNQGDSSATEFSIHEPTETNPQFAPVFSDGSIMRYRLKHDATVLCPCEYLGQFDNPIARYIADDGTLTIAFYTRDYDDLREIIGGLQERFPGINIKRLVRSPTPEHQPESVFVDRNKLTARQLVVLRVAYESGYFTTPRATNATEIAAELNIDPSTFAEHIATALSKIVGDVLEDG